MRVTARLDAAAATGPDAIDHALGVLTRAGSTEVIAVIYDDAVALAAEPGGGPRAAASRTSRWGDLPSRLAVATGDAGCALVHVLLVSQGRWWPQTCPGPECCPGAGSLVAEPTTSLAAAATVAGLTALPSRAALARTLLPRPPADRERLCSKIVAAQRAADGQSPPGATRRAATRALFAAARTADAGGSATDDDTASRLGAALTRTDVRDSVWMAVDAVRLDGRTLWADLARRLPAPYDAPPAFLYGWACWRRGDGASARIAVQRALESDGSYTAAQLLEVALVHGMDPRRVPRLRRSAGSTKRPNAQAGRTRGR